MVKKDQNVLATPTVQIKKPKKLKSLQNSVMQQKMAHMNLKPREVVNLPLPQQLFMQEWENKDYEILSKVPDAIPNLAKYCHENSLPEPIFQTHDFGIYQEVIAQVGKLEFFAKGPPQTATKDAAYGLLNKIQKLDREELDLIKTENILGKILLLILFFLSLMIS